VPSAIEAPGHIVAQRISLFVNACHHVGATLAHERATSRLAEQVDLTANY